MWNSTTIYTAQIMHKYLGWRKNLFKSTVTSTLLKNQHWLPTAHKETSKLLLPCRLDLATSPGSVFSTSSMDGGGTLTNLSMTKSIHSSRPASDAPHCPKCCPITHNTWVLPSLMCGYYQHPPPPFQHSSPSPVTVGH